MEKINPTMVELKTKAGVRTTLVLYDENIVRIFRDNADVPNTTDRQVSFLFSFSQRCNRYLAAVLNLEAQQAQLSTK